MKRVAVDWDGVLVAEGDWLPGAVAFLGNLQRRGLQPFIHSSRASYSRGESEIRSGLHDARLSGIVVISKPEALAYVDDRAVRFDGDFGRAMRAVRALR